MFATPAEDHSLMTDSMMACVGDGGGKRTTQKDELKQM